MVVVYQIIDEQTHIVQVETAYLTKEEWTIHERGEYSNRTRTAVTTASATQKLRENSVYLDPKYATHSEKDYQGKRARKTSLDITKKLLLAKTQSFRTILHRPLNLHFLTIQRRK
jgi:hypothetical protein